ncbi:hypothetical protein VUR80DRAFT_5945 [Thermomyces stellatus]
MCSVECAQCNCPWGFSKMRFTVGGRGPSVSCTNPSASPFWSISPRDEVACTRRTCPWRVPRMRKQLPLSAPSGRSRGGGLGEVRSSAVLTLHKCVPLQEGGRPWDTPFYLLISDDSRNVSSSSVRHRTFAEDSAVRRTHLHPRHSRLASLPWFFSRTQGVEASRIGRLNSRLSGNFDCVWDRLPNRRDIPPGRTRTCAPPEGSLRPSTVFPQGVMKWVSVRRTASGCSSSQRRRAGKVLCSRREGGGANMAAAAPTDQVSPLDPEHMIAYASLPWQVRCAVQQRATPPPGIQHNAWLRGTSSIGRATPRRACNHPRTPPNPLFTSSHDPFRTDDGPAALARMSSPRSRKDEDLTETRHLFVLLARSP